MTLANVFRANNGKRAKKTKRSYQRLCRHRTSAQPEVKMLADCNFRERASWSRRRGAPTLRKHCICNLQTDLCAAVNDALIDICLLSRPVTPSASFAAPAPAPSQRELASKL